MDKFTDEEADLATIRERITRMSDVDLLKYGRAASFFAGGKEPGTWRAKADEVMAEWLRRHPMVPDEQ